MSRWRVGGASGSGFHGRPVAWVVGVVLLGLVLASAVVVTRGGDRPEEMTRRAEGVSPPVSTSRPTAPISPTPVCGQPILRSPYSHEGPPATYGTSGAPGGLPTFGSPGTDFPTMDEVVVVPAGDNRADALAGAFSGTRTIYYFAPGTHAIDLMYTGHDSVYIGGYSEARGKAVLDGVDGATGGDGLGGSYLSLSTPSSGNNTDNTWMYLTVQNYSSSLDNAVMGNVNGGGLSVGDVYRFNTIGPNDYGWRGEDRTPARGQSSGGGYGIGFSDDTTIEHNCLTSNAQGGFNGSGVGITVSHNEISRNGLGVYPDSDGPGGSPHACGCSGGGKVLASTNATLEGNFVHDNYNAGIWLDFNNTGADISSNWIESNWGPGIFYEASYNAHITDNRLVGNGWASHGVWPEGIDGRACFGGVSCTNGGGPVTGAGGGFPYSAIYIANSGGNRNVEAVRDEEGRQHASRFAGEVVVRGNLLSDNFGGVAVYTDTDRYPGGINGNSACSVPLNGGSDLYYRQTKVLTGGGATLQGSAVRIPDGLRSLCSPYDSGSLENGADEEVPRTPSSGMAVYDIDSGTFLGLVAEASGPGAVTLDRSPGDARGVTLLVSAYGGCGPADYFGSGPGISSGRPSLPYWDNCIWGSRDVKVTGNIFSLDGDRVRGCTLVARCGFMQTVAFNAGVPQLVRYFHRYRDLIALAAGGLGNVWSGNAYHWSGDGAGAWRFHAGAQGDEVSRQAWTAGPYGQDVGSTFDSAAVP